MNSRWLSYRAMLLARAAPASYAPAMRHPWIRSRWRLIESISLFIPLNKRPILHSSTGGFTMAIDYVTAESSTKEIVHEQLYCALTGVPVSAEEAYWAPPLVTF